MTPYHRKISEELLDLRQSIETYQYRKNRKRQPCQNPDLVTRIIDSKKALLNAKIVGFFTARLSIALSVLMMIPMTAWDIAHIQNAGKLPVVVDGLAFIVICISMYHYLRYRSDIWQHKLSADIDKMEHNLYSQKGSFTQH